MRIKKMKGKLKIKVFTILIFSICCFLLFSGCDKGLRGRVTALSNMEAQDGEVSKKRIEEIQKSIREYQDNLKKAVSSAKKLGDFYRSLGLEYMGLEMYGLALENFQEAMDYHSNSAGLYFYAAICSGQLSRNSITASERNAYLEMAEQYYLVALRINPKYNDAIYALAIIYQYEMDRFFEAEELMETLLLSQPDNINALFVMAACKTSLLKIEEAVACYEKIALQSRDESVKARAMQNRDELLGRAING